MRYDFRMPIYDFKCRACGCIFEELVKLGYTPDCPECGGNDLATLISLPAISTETSRKRSAGKARERADRVRKEQKHAQAEYERNYIKDHS
jgi:putative FmdB family regulatory protein